MSWQDPVTDHLIFLDRNENPYGPAPACIEALRDFSVRELSYYSRDYERKVKSKLSERLSETLRLPEEQILLSYGSEDMLKQAVHCYLRPGEKILIPNLSWWYYRSVASEVNGTTVEYALREGPDSYCYDAKEISKLVREEQPRVLLLASPNNPTGNSISRKDLEALLEQSSDTVMILDEAYRGFATVQNDEASRLVQQYDNLLILRTFSKFYALAGSRIGYALVGKNLERLKNFSARYLGYNLLSEKLALAALDSTDYYNEMRRKMIEDRNQYFQELNSVQGWKAYESEANFILVKIPKDVTSSLRRWLESKAIKVKYFDQGSLRACIRITIGTREQNLFLLGALKEFVEVALPIQRAATQ